MNNQLSATVVQDLPYVDLLAMLRESNLPPGGVEAVSGIADAVSARPGLQCLHAGCNAGFLSRQIHYRTGASVVGMDISPHMVEAANEVAADEGISAFVRHEVGDMRNMPYESATFDRVFSGGAMAFVEGHQDAVSEWIRVCKPWGLLVDCHFYYTAPPPARVRERVEEIISVDIPVYDRDYWLALYDRDEIEIEAAVDVPVRTKSAPEIEAYCAEMVAHVMPGVDGETAAALESRWFDMMSAFDENMRHMGATLVRCSRWPDASEPRLFV